MQSLIVGLVLAGVSATTLVAFKHPHGYAKLFPYLVGAATTVFVCVSMWHVAIAMTWSGLEQFVVLEKLGDAENVVEGLRIPYLWIGFSFVALLIFLWVNLKLPPFLQVADGD